LQAALPKELEVSLHRGSDSPPLGWISRSFDARTATTTVRVHGKISASMRFLTHFKIQFADPERDASVATDHAMEIQ
jgi:hypothetical protein